jgi:hypothetical protein
MKYMDADDDAHITEKMTVKSDPGRRIVNGV